MDGLAFTEIVETCFEARRSLAHVLREITLGLAWPTQTLLNTIVLLGKKAGGTRCVSVCATLYRLLMAIFKADIRSWDAGVASELDSAVAGRMPQIETAKRSLFMEVKTRNGETVIAIMWDVKKYFDSIQIPELIVRARELDFPEVALTLGLQMHRAPRIIKGLSTMAMPIERSGRSILPGCTLSTSLAQ